MPLRKIRRPATKDKCRKVVSDNIRFLMEEGRPQKQAIAIALSVARKSGCRIPDTRKGRAGGANRVFIDAEIRTVGAETFATVTWLDTHGKRHSAQGPRQSLEMRALLTAAAEDGVRARHVVKPIARGVDHAFGASGGRTSGGRATESMPTHSCVDAACTKVRRIPGRASGRRHDVPMGQHRFEKYAFELSGSSEGPVRVKVLDITPGSIFKSRTAWLLESFNPSYSHRQGYTLSRKKALEFYEAAREGADTSPRQQAKKAREDALAAEERRKIQKQVIAWGGAAEGEYAFLDTAYGRLEIHPITRSFIATRFLDPERARPWTESSSGKWNFHGDTAASDLRRALEDLRALRCTAHADCKKNEALGRACLIEQAKRR